MVPQQRLAAGEVAFRLGPLPAGDYDLLCDIDGRGRLSQTGLRLGIDQTLRLPPFAADAQRPLVVALRHADGRPAIGASVRSARTHEPFSEVEPGRYVSRPIGAADDDLLVRGPDFAPEVVPMRVSDPLQPIVHTVTPAVTVEVRFEPPTPRERWVGALQLRLSDANGQELVNDMIRIDGAQEFVWAIGLRPGTYSLRCSAFGDGRGERRRCGWKCSSRGSA